MSIFQTLARALAIWKGPKPTPTPTHMSADVRVRGAAITSTPRTRILVSDDYMGADRRQRQDPNQNHLRRRDDWPELPPVNRD